MSYNIFKSRLINYKHQYLVISYITIILVISIGAFNWFIDPYRFFNSPVFEGINKNKPEFSNHVRIGKKRAVETLKPNALIFGTSRVEHAIDPLHNVFENYKTYNFGVSGASIREITHNFKYANMKSTMKMAVIGLDFYSFNAFWINDVDLSLKDNYNNYFTNLISYGVIKSSIKTIKKQSSPLSMIYAPKGNIIIKPEQLYFKKFGGLLKYTEMVEKNFFCNDWFPSKSKTFAFYRKDKNYYTFDSFRELIRIAMKNNIELKIFITPIHARMLEVMFYSKLFKKYNTFRHKVVQILDEEANSLGKKVPILWDFSGYNKYTSYSIAKLAAAKKTLPWHIESSHYNYKLGNIILNKMFYISNESNNFGVQLNKNNITDHINKLSSNRLKFLSSNQIFREKFRKLFSNPKLSICNL